MPAADLQGTILGRCIDIDSVAYQIYASFAATESTPGLGELWKDLGAEEAQHIGYWRRLSRQYEEGLIPALFDDAARLDAMLEDAGRKVHALMGSIRPEMDAQRRLTVACTMELTFLHQPLLQALRYARAGAAEADPLVAYDGHLRRFLDGARAFVTSPDLQLSVDALARMWDGTKSLMERAFTDPLTGLLNRRGLADTATPLANLARRNGASVGIAVLDLDRFKAVNDTWGHDAGDRVLVATARLVRATVRSSDLVARVGGEEFVVFLSEVEAAWLPEVGEKIRREVAAAPVDGIPVTVSIGMASGRLGRDDDVEQSIAELTKRADAGLYRAKQEGRNRVVVETGG